MLLKWELCRFKNSGVIGSKTDGQMYQHKALDNIAIGLKVVDQFT